MKKMINRTLVEGYLYDSKLEEKTYKETAKRPGAKYIQGTVDIATDDNLTNIVSVHYSFVSEPLPEDKPMMRSRYETLANIMNGTVKSVMNSDKEHAAKLSLSSSIGLLEFPTERNGVEEMVCTKRNEGGFISAANKLRNEDDRNTFDVDIIIVGARRIDADEERELPEKVVISGYIFDYFGSIMPVEFTALGTGAMNYFEGLEPSKKSPVFTRIKGHQVSTTVPREIVEKSAFGEDRVRVVMNNRKDWIVDWAQEEEYAFDEEDTISAEEVKKALSEREIRLADMKNRRKNATNAIADAPAAATPAKSKYTIKKSTDAFDF